PEGVRDRALLELLYATGMRASECLSLRLEDVNLAAGYVVCTGKGSRQRLVPVGGPALEWTRAYLASARRRLARRRDGGTLFLGPRGGPLTRQALWLVVRKWARRAGLTDVRVVPCPADASVLRGRALLGTGRGRALVLAGQKALVFPGDLARAMALGLETLRVAELARPVPAVLRGDSEVGVRRRLL